MYRTLLVVLLAVAIMTSGTEAKIWYVYPDGSGGAPTLQAAIDSCAVSGDNILIKGGVYHQGNLVSSGKNITIDQFEGQVYINSPSPGSGTGLSIRNTVTFTLSSVAFRNFETAVAVESATPYIQWITVRTCNRGVTVSGATSSPTMWYALIDSCGTGIDILGGGTITLRNQTITNCSTGARFASATSNFTRNIVYNCDVGVQCTGGSANINCNDFFMNAANYGGCAAGTTDFYTDPMFCFWKSPAPGFYWLHVSSPCLTAANPCGLKVGAFTSTAGCSGTAVEKTTWGAIKNIYR